MAEIGQYFFSHKEIVEMLIKQQDIHEGKWSLLVAIGSTVANIGPTPEQIVPSVLVQLQKIGIQRMPGGLPPENGITVDAGVVNPARPAQKPRKALKASKT